jgi:tetraacyldisaccharide 4'-kinase
MEFTGLKIFLLPLAWAASQVYGLGVLIRSRLYRQRLLPSRNLPCKVISIGNLVTGGTGKTPHTALLAGYLKKKGVKAAVLSRGYRGKKMRQGAVVSDDRNLLATREDSGEEPYWLARKLPGVPVLIGKNRYRSGLRAFQNWNISWAILDDGFQHLALKRDLDILLLSGVHPFGNGRLLPLGSLREPKGAMKRADVVLITHSEQISSRERTELRSGLRGLGFQKPVFFSEHLPIGLKQYPDDEPLPLAWLEAKRVLAFCGLARPDSLVFTLKQLRVASLELAAFPDHYAYGEKDWKDLTVKARSLGVDCLVTTEKDALKLEGWKPMGIKMVILEIECRINDPDFWRLIDSRLAV